ncbi:PHP domain-containing protein [Anaerotignum lactatifermentans]|uniref:PHP domain-containing protein n=1 Tax=Anaerotignum lactatifermentans TaxID=160404 RepID=A0ABS2G7Z6_9FIRM|nr:PHP domain-containing protein [Anaerotignum lactatifermentans]MBM6877155.1 PHP domain-containing protein [Anaerotignum lactatifermentans]MBM6951393.1 PHP domain-containing protein [Anaerotignum lactatifermentans]
MDLHTHSYCSDGTFSPEGLVILAKKQGLRAIALTDHDTTDGLTLFREAGEKHGMETICGIEFAALWEHRHQPEIHIVGLGFSPNAPALASALTEIKESRDRRNEKMAAQLRAIGLPVTLEEVAKNAGGQIITRAHFANVLLQKHLVPDRAAAFSRYLSPGCPGYVAREFLTPKLCIDTIHAAGGVAVLAHPTLYGLEENGLRELCRELCGFGLDGIECFYSTYTPAQTKQILRLAEEFHLLPSGGSDFHGDNKPDIQLGRGKGNLSIPYSLWEALREKTQKNK